MQWGQIKSLFILSFLLLDIYLIVLVVQKQDDVSLLESTSTEEQAFLEIENITIPENLPESVPNESLMATEPKQFTEDEIAEITTREDQDVVVVNDRFILAYLKTPFAVPENAKEEEIEQLLASTVYLGDEYTFDSWDSDRNVMIFFQKKDTRTIYYNQNGMILAFLNDNDEIVGYMQTYLGELEVINAEESVVKPLSAIRELYNKNALFSNEEVTGFELGYHTFFPSDSGRQVLVPTWKFTINESRSRLVDAFERKVIPVNNEFVDNVIKLSIDNTLAIAGDEDFKQEMLDLMSSKLEQSE
ncbi:two-component system regulatory protein YycI [Ornithinibacillus sp. FSL M8-0202]|uniref:two-component system regulatory protein YycI n=1 Tax=unclassified Ornithinibacillus TaxID=2620869 RepID=UPI0030D2103B